MLAEADAKHEPVWFPVEVYGNPVLRRLLQISEQPGNVLRIANLARGIEDFSAQLNAPVASGDHVFCLGGEAQLEGLGQVSQVHSVEYTFGVEDVLAISGKYVHAMDPGGPYRSIEAVAGTLGCGQYNGKVTVLNLNLASALFITALCDCFFGAGPEPAADLLAPMYRLSRLLSSSGLLRAGTTCPMKRRPNWQIEPPSVFGGVPRSRRSLPTSTRWKRKSTLTRTYGSVWRVYTMHTRIS